VVGSALQSGRLKNQKSAPQTSDTTDPAVAGSDVVSPAPVAAETDTDRHARGTDSHYTAITWEHSVRSALKNASDGNKLVVVDVYADWCGWCKKMDRTIYSDPKVASLSGNVIFVKINAEDPGEGRQFARDNHISGLPTTIILDHKGAVVNKVAGYIASPDSFISLVQKSMARR
jgi:thiol:disulfide interchange protein